MGCQLHFQCFENFFEKPESESHVIRKQGKNQIVEYFSNSMKIKLTKSRLYCNMNHV